MKPLRNSVGVRGCHLNLLQVLVSPVLLLVMLVGCSNPLEYSVVSKVLDGDTIEVKGGERIRLACIDAPELAQPLGIMSRNWLAENLNRKGGLVRVQRLREDRFGRTVGILFVGDININIEMVEIGMAYGFTPLAHQCPIWDDVYKAQQKASLQGLGVWSGNFQLPWDYRRQQEKK